MKCYNPTSMPTLSLNDWNVNTGLSVVKTYELPSNNMLFIQSSNKIEQIGQQSGRERGTQIMTP